MISAAPAWLDNLADDVTMEGAVLNGVVRGAESVRTLCEFQEFVFLGDGGDYGFVEDYSSRVHGQPIANIAIVKSDESGKVVHLVMNHRPLSAALLFPRLMGEHFKDTPYAAFFAASESGTPNGGPDRS